MQNKASLHAEQALFVSKNEWFWHANKSSFYPKAACWGPKAVVLARESSKNAALETLKRKLPMSKKNTILRLF